MGVGAGRAGEMGEEEASETGEEAGWGEGGGEIHQQLREQEVKC